MALNVYISNMKIRLKLRECPPAFPFLFACGFSQSIDGLRWEFKLKNWKMIQKGHAALTYKLQESQTQTKS